MSVEKYPIELDANFVEKFYGLADLPTPSEVTLENMQIVLIKIKDKISNFALKGAGSNAPTKTESSYLKGGEVAASKREKRVLVVDDLNIITYQLEILFKRIGYEIIVSNEINDAIAKYKIQDFGYVLIDLFIPTEREGFILLDEIKKLSLLCNLNTKIIVMTASSKPEYETSCKNHGAECYIEKAAGWQKEVMEACTVD